jgi:hypothetical protein
MTTTLDEALFPILEQVTAVLSDYDPVTQQKILELATVRHVMRAREHARFVATSMHKHVTQLIEQCEDFQR